jgi:hypothetical protein
VADDLEHVREQLEAARRLGLSFETAWRRALRDVRARDVQVALAETKDARRSSFKREPPTRGHLAVVLLFDSILSEDERGRAGAASVA